MAVWLELNSGYLGERSSWSLSPAEVLVAAEDELRLFFCSG